MTCGWLETDDDACPKHALPTNTIINIRSLFFIVSRPELNPSKANPMPKQAPIFVTFTGKT
jgi:hypothetical protein